MFIVLISARYKKILEWIQENVPYKIYVVKGVGAKIFLYVDTKQSFHEIQNELKKVIDERGGSTYVYAFYTLYDGMIDYTSYLSEETKKQQKYYQSLKKDLSEEEMKTFVGMIE